jgi:hypothetical protein
MNVPQDSMRDFFTNHRHPTVDLLNQIDAPDYLLTINILRRLFEVPVRFDRNPNDVTFYAADRSEALLVIDADSAVTSPNALTQMRINAFLRAGRIHFIESYDWVNWTPEMRADLLKHEAADVGLPIEDFKKMLSKWVS